MLGRFLEISIHTPEIRESLTFYESLGLVQAVTSDVWPHHYAVVTDGTVALGLHEYEFSSPSLTWVMPGLARHLTSLSDAGLEFEFLKTGEDEFHELGFRDPDGQMVTILEARTYSPLSERIPPPAIGFFREYRYPVRRLSDSADFWEPALVFDCPDMTATAGALERLGVTARAARDPVSGDDSLQFDAPEGTPLILLPESV